MKEATDTGKSESAHAAGQSGEQLLHLVFGGELVDLDAIRFRDLDALDMVGIYPNYASVQEVEGKCADDGRQRPYALFHRPSAPLARS